MRSERTPLGTVNHNVPRACEEYHSTAAKKALLAEQSRVRMSDIVEARKQKKKKVL
jgi:hypothetical protein